MSDDADVLLGLLAEAQQMEKAYLLVQARRALLLRCQAIGIKAALAEDRHHVGTQPIPDPDGIGEILHELNNPALAFDTPRRVDIYRAALERLDRRKRPVLWASLQDNLGVLLAESAESNRAERLEQAIEAFAQAVEMFAQSPMRMKWAATLVNLANAYANRVRGERAENGEIALQVCNEALEVLTVQGAPTEWARAMMTLGNIYRLRVTGERADNIERAIEIYEQALTVRTRQSLPIEWAQTSMNLATAFMERIKGDQALNLERAIAEYEQVTQVFTRDAAPVEWAKTMLNLGTTYQKRLKGNPADNIDRAIDIYRQVLNVATLDMLPTDWTMAVESLATAYVARVYGDRAENIERSIEFYDQALQVMTREGMPFEWAIAIDNLGTAYRERVRGDRAENIERAIECHQKALEVLTREAAPLDWALKTVNLGNAYRQRLRGDRAENIEAAIQAYEAALEVTTLEAMPADWATTIQNLASIYVDRVRGDRAENIDRAISLAFQVLRVATRETMPLDWSRIMHNLGNTYANRRNGDPAENLNHAIKAYQEALQIRTADALPAEHRRTQTALGDLLFGHERWVDAVQAFAGALHAANQLYNVASTPEARQAELGESSDVPMRLAYARAKSGDMRGAVVSVELGRARALAEALALSEASLESLPSQERRAFEEARAKIKALQAEARLPERTPGKRGFTTLTEHLRRAYSDLESIVTLIRRHIPDFLKQNALADIRAAASIAPLVYLLSTRAGGLALIVRADSEPVSIWLPALTAAKLHDHVAKYFAAYSLVQYDTGSWLRELDDIGEWLWDVAMGPIAQAVLPARAGVLIPAGLLGLLPLHAAWCRHSAAPTGRLYVLDLVAFTYSPNANALVTGRRAANVTSPEGLLAIDEPRPVRAGALPNSSREVAAAVAMFDRSYVLRHHDATRSAVLQRLPEYPVLHFSCHGRADFDQPLDSGLAMADDELLCLRDFLNLRLPAARLAVLSACETGVPAAELPNEVVSLPSGLLQAGVAGIAASLWSVADQSTMMLMVRFYELWRKRGVQPLEALVAAQKWVRDTSNSEKLTFFEGFLPEFAGDRATRVAADALCSTIRQMCPEAQDFAHPFHWAAFSYTGS